jgi:DNA-binding MarR family transcriptional regulator
MAVIDVDRYVLETLMADLVGHDHHPSAFIVYMALWMRTERSRERRVSASHRELAEGTGLSKRAVQTAIARLVRRKLVAVERESATAIPVYAVLRPWARRSAHRAA